MFHGLLPSIPEAAQPDAIGPRYINLPPGYGASLYQSPTDGPFLAEWGGSTPMTVLGQRFEDGHARWQLARDPLGNEGWIAELFLSEQPPDYAPPDQDEAYLSAVAWAGEIVICANPAGGPPGLDGDDFVTLVAVAVARWQATADGLLPLRTAGRCDADPNLRGDGINVVGWTPDVGLVIAGLAWPDADAGTMGETDVMLSRAYFERLHAQRPSRTIRACAFSTLVHELGHVIGLDHPRSRLLKSTMQAVGASRCDKAIPSASDRAQLLTRYGPGGQ